MTTNQARNHRASRRLHVGLLAAAAILLGGNAFGMPSAVGEGRELDMGIYEECMNKPYGPYENPHDRIALCCIDAGGDPVFAPGTDIQVECAAPIPEAEPFNPQQSGPIVVPGEVADPVTPVAPRPIVRPTGPLAPAAG